MLYSNSPLALCFTQGGVCISVRLSIHPTLSLPRSLFSASAPWGSEAEAFLSPVSYRQDSGRDDLPQGRFAQLLIEGGAAPEPSEIKGTREGHQDWEG